MRVVVAEDSAIFREGLERVLLEHGHELVAAVGDARAVFGAVAGADIDLLILDIRLPPRMESDGAEAALALRQTYPYLGLLMLSQHISLHPLIQLIGTPRFGYLLKDRVIEVTDFIAAAERVAAGGTVLDPDVIQALVRSKAGNQLAHLSGRERNVLALVAEGLSNVAIAGRLVLSERTVETHVRSVFTKLGIGDDGTFNRRVLAAVKYLESQ